MDENTPLEPLTPEDLDLLIGLAKPIYAESKNVERMTGSNTVVNGRPDDGSTKIRMGLEQIARSVQAPPVYQTYVNPNISSGGTPTAFPSHDPNLGGFMMLPASTTPDPSPQMELNFDVSEQKKTNVLLEEISRKLTKLVSHFLRNP